MKKKIYLPPRFDSQGSVKVDGICYGRVGRSKHKVTTRFIEEAFVACWDCLGLPSPSGISPSPSIFSPSPSGVSPSPSPSEYVCPSPPPVDCPAMLPSNLTVYVYVDGNPDYAICTTSCVPCMWFGYSVKFNVALIVRLNNEKWEVTSSDPITIHGYLKLCGSTPMGAYTEEDYVIGTDHDITDIHITDDFPIDCYELSQFWWDFGCSPNPKTLYCVDFDGIYNLTINPQIGQGSWTTEQSLIDFVWGQWNDENIHVILNWNSVWYLTIYPDYVNYPYCYVELIGGTDPCNPASLPFVFSASENVSGYEGMEVRLQECDCASLGPWPSQLCIELTEEQWDGWGCINYPLTEYCLNFNYLPTIEFEFGPPFTLTLERALITFRQGTYQWFDTATGIYTYTLVLLNKWTLQIFRTVGGAITLEGGSDPCDPTTEPYVYVSSFGIVGDPPTDLTMRLDDCICTSLSPSPSVFSPSPSPSLSLSPSPSPSPSPFISPSPSPFFSPSPSPSPNPVWGFDDASLDETLENLVAYWPMTDNPALYDECGKVVTPYSGPSPIDTTNKKFGSGSLKYQNGLRLWTPDHADFDVGAGDFTIECWVKTTGTNIFLYNRIDGSTNGIQFFIDSSGYPRVYCGNGSSWFVTSGAWSVAVNDNALNHVALVRSGNDWIGFVNGVVRWSATISGTVGNPTGRNANIGVYTTDDSNYSYHYTGNIDEFRFSKGIARWTADFSGNLPAAEYAVDSYTKLLLHLNNATYQDTVGSNHLANWHLGQQVTGKNGNAVYLKRGSNDRLYVPVNSDIGPIDKMTIAYWVKHISFTGEQYHCANRGATTDAFFLDAYTSGRFMYSVWQSNGTQKYEDIATPFANLDQWYHAALVVDGSYIRMYADGSPVGTPIAYDGTIRVADGNLNWGSNNTPGGFADVYLCEAGLWNGLALTADQIATLATGKYYRQY